MNALAKADFEVYPTRGAIALSGRRSLVWTAVAVLFTAAVLVFSHVVVAAIVTPVFRRISRVA